MNDINIENIMNEIRENTICDSESFDISQIYSTPMTTYHKKMLGQLEEFNELVLFGIGHYGKMILRGLKSGGIGTIKCLCDNDPKIIGTEVDGYKVYTPEDSFEKYPEAAFIITAINYPVEITAQLLKMGVRAEKIFFYNFARSGL